LVEVRSFVPDDAARIELQPEQAAQLAAVPDWRDMLCAAPGAGPVWTIEAGGRVVCIAGLSVIWPGRAACWCYLAAGVPAAAWVALHRAVAARLRQVGGMGIRRVEAEVRAGWAPGERWVRMLGFRPEGVAEGYFPDGSACSRWARVDA
jgi:hypothetical protein